MQFRYSIVVTTCLTITLGMAIPAGVSFGSNAMVHREISKKTAEKQYLALVDPANLALDNFASQAQTWTNSTTATQAEQDAAPSITALSKVSAGLKHDRWPSKTQHDIKSLSKAIVRINGDLKSLGTINSFDASTWTSTFMRDASALKSVVEAVRHSLGLPES